MADSVPKDVGGYIVVFRWGQVRILLHIIYDYHELPNNNNSNNKQAEILTFSVLF